MPNFTMLAATIRNVDADEARLLRETTAARFWAINEELAMIATAWRWQGNKDSQASRVLAILDQCLKDVERELS